MCARVPPHLRSCVLEILNYVVSVQPTSNYMYNVTTHVFRPLEYSWNVIGIFQLHSNYIPTRIVSKYETINWGSGGMCKIVS